MLAAVAAADGATRVALEVEENNDGAVAHHLVSRVVSLFLVGIW